MWVRARDGGGLAGEAPVSVFVLGAHDEAPRVQAPPADLFLREDAPPGTLVAQLRADGPAPRYRLAPALWPRDLFAVDDAGRLVLSGQLDRETAAEHLIGERDVSTDSWSRPPKSYPYFRMLIEFDPVS